MKELKQSLRIVLMKIYLHFFRIFYKKQTEKNLQYNTEKALNFLP